MLLLSLLITPIIGIFIVSTISDESDNFKFGKSVGLTTSVINLTVSLLIFMLFNFSSNQFQFVQEYHEISSFDFYLGVDGVSIFFVLLTTIIMPISLLSNWSSITENVKSYVIIILLLETLLLGVFLVLDILMFYIFFESILPPLFLLIGIFGSNNRVRAGFYLFLYTLLGSLFLLLSILTMSSIMGTTDFDALFKTNFSIYIQIILYSGIFIAFAVKTPTIFLNSWLLKAHVESPLGGSIILAGIVLKLSLYGILRVILPLLPKAYTLLTPMVFVIGVVTILYASLSTLRTIDVKELIAYSSVSHAAVYLLGVFSNSIQGIEGGIILGLAHGFVSSGLFICAGGVLYDRSSTRLITFYRGVTQLMPLFSILFFILCLGNAGTPLSLNFIGEFMSLYGTFERLPPLGVFASSSIVFSAAYTIYMFNRISFGGSISKLLTFNIPDVSKREFYILLVLVGLTVFFGVYPSPILDGLHYNVSCLGYMKELAFLLPVTLSTCNRRNFSVTSIKKISSFKDITGIGSKGTNSIEILTEKSLGLQNRLTEIKGELTTLSKNDPSQFKQISSDFNFAFKKYQAASDTFLHATQNVKTFGLPYNIADLWYTVDCCQAGLNAIRVLEKHNYLVQDHHTLKGELSHLFTQSVILRDIYTGPNPDIDIKSYIPDASTSQYNSEVTALATPSPSFFRGRPISVTQAVTEPSRSAFASQSNSVTQAVTDPSSRAFSNQSHSIAPATASSSNADVAGDTTPLSESTHDQLFLFFLVNSSSLELSAITRGITMLWISYIQFPVGYFQYLYLSYIIIPLKKWFNK